MKKTFKEELTSDAKEVGYRQAAKKTTSIAHAVILHGAKNQLGLETSELATVKKLLESDYFAALLGYGLGKALGKFGPEGEFTEKLSEEFRVSGLDRAADAGLQKVMEIGPSMLPAVGAMMNAVKTANSGDMLEAIAAWSKVDEALPSNVRVALEETEKISQEIEQYEKQKVRVPSPAVSPAVSPDIPSPASEPEVEEEQPVLQAIPGKLVSCS